MSIAKNFVQSYVPYVLDILRGYVTIVLITKLDIEPVRLLIHS